MADERTILLKVELDVNDLKKSQQEAAVRVDELTAKRKDLKDATEQDTVAIAENNLELRKARKELNDTTKAIKIAEEAQEANTGSIKEMREQLAAANVVYNNMSEDVRKSPVGRELASQMEEIKSAITKAREEVGDFTGNIGNYENAVDAAIKKNFDLTATFEDVHGEGVQPMTTRIGELEDRMYELVAAGEAGGEEFAALQGEAAKLRKVIIQTDASVDALAESGGALGSALQIGEGVLQGYQAVTGITALLGTENEQLLEVLTKLEATQAVLNSLQAANSAIQQNAIKFTQRRAQAQRLLNVALGNGSKAAKVFRGALLATGVGALIVGVGLLIENFDDLKAMVTGVDETQQALNETQEDYRRGAADAVKTVNKVESAFKLARDGVMSKDEALLIYNKNLGDTLGHAKELNEAERIFAEKTDAYIKAAGLRAQADALFAKAAEEQAEGLTAQMEVQTNWWDTNVAALKLLSGGWDDAQEHMKNAQREGVKEARKTSKARSDIFTNAAQELLKQAENIESANEITSESEKDLEDERKRQHDEWKKRQDELKKIEEERLKRAEEIAKRLRDLAIGETELNLSGQRAAIEAHYEFLEAAAVDNANNLLQIEADKNADLEALELRELEAAKQRLRNKFEDEKKEFEDSAEVQKELEETLNLELAALDTEHKNQSVLREQAHNLRVEELAKEREQAEREALDSIELITRELALERAKGAAEEFQAWKDLQLERIRQVEILRDREVQAEGQTEAEKVAIRKNAELEIQRIQNETFVQEKANQEELKEGRKQLAISIVQSADQLAGSLIQIAQNQTQEELNIITNKHNAESQLLQDQLNAGLISQAEFNAQKSEIDANFAAGESALKRKQFETNKAAQLINATIATAVGVASALPNIPLSIIAGALGAAQIALIASQPTPELEAGGIAPLKSGIFGGKRHTQGGTKGYFDDGTNVEVERDELFVVLNRKATAELTALSNHNKANGGRQFMRDGGVMKFQTGGVFAQSVASPVEDRFRQQQILENSLRAMPRPVVAVQDINDAQGNLAEVEDRANF